MLRENSQGDRAAVGLLGFCLNFILLGGERNHWVHARKRGDGKLGRSCVAVPVGLSPLCPLLGLLWGVWEGTLAHFSQRRGRKILLCYPVSCNFGQAVVPGCW